jgi:hypothetical protein
MKKLWLKVLAPAALIGALALPALGQATPDNSDRTPRINARQVNQQRRIEQGVKSGQLTPGETHRLERQQANIQANKLQDKADGHITPQERASLTRQQNRASRTIYRDKHNDKTVPR